jgi:hypothetical protein
MPMIIKVFSTTDIWEYTYFILGEGIAEENNSYNHADPAVDMRVNSRVQRQ